MVTGDQTGDLHSLNQRAQPLVFPLIAPHRLGLDRERQRRVGVPHVLHHDGWRFADAVQQRREAAPRPVRCERRQRRLAGFLQPLVRALDGPCHHAFADVGGFCGLPAVVPNTSASGFVSSRALSSASTSRNTGRIFTLRRPASVLDWPIVSQPPARSTSCQRNARNSEIRSPAKTSVASCARRLTCWRSTRDSPSRSAAASSSATICRAESRYGRCGRSALSLRRLPRAGLAGRYPYSTATSRICASSPRSPPACAAGSSRSLRVSRSCLRDWRCRRIALIRPSPTEEAPACR